MVLSEASWFSGGIFNWVGVEIANVAASHAVAPDKSSFQVSRLPRKTMPRSARSALWPDAGMVATEISSFKLPQLLFRSRWG